MDTQGKRGADAGSEVCSAHEHPRTKPRAAMRVHIGISMLSPQLLHFNMEVEDMRTIVECSPQLGHTEESSKRCRQ
jgi:hypothetical protein